MRNLSVEDVKRLLGVRFIPGSPEEIEVLRAWTQDLVQAKGEGYLRKYRRKLCREWTRMRDRGLSRV